MASDKATIKQLRDITNDLQQYCEQVSDYYNKVLHTKLIRGDQSIEAIFKTKSDKDETTLDSYISDLRRMFRDVEPMVEALEWGNQQDVKSIFNGYIKFLDKEVRAFIANREKSKSLLQNLRSTSNGRFKETEVVIKQIAKYFEIFNTQTIKEVKPELTSNGIVKLAMTADYVLISAVKIADVCRKVSEKYPYSKGDLDCITFMRGIVGVLKSVA